MDEPIKKIVKKNMARTIGGLEEIWPGMTRKAKKIIMDGIEWTASDVVKEQSGNVRREG